MKRLATLALLAAAVTAGAKVTPSVMLTDNMVLKQNSNARITGKAKPGEKITAIPSWNNQKYTVKASNDGRWSIALPTPAGGFEAYTIKVADSSKDTLTVKNVLIGEVWLASGQSNMEMNLTSHGGTATRGGKEEIVNSRDQANYIRLFNVPRVQSVVPEDTVACSWTVPNPVAASDFSAVAWFFAKTLSHALDVPVGIVSAAYGGTKVEGWLPKEIVKDYPDFTLDPDSIMRMNHMARPTTLYNAMFHPVKDYSYSGVIWYQGCSNSWDLEHYGDRQKTLIKQWRKDIGEGDIPFFITELAPYIQHGGKGAEFREVQWKAAEETPNAGIVCTNDLVMPEERFNIHPENKYDVGARHAYLALNKVYGQDIYPVQNPTIESWTVEGPEVTLKFKTDWKNLSHNLDVKGFEIAGEDGVFYPAVYEPIQYNPRGKVYSDKVANPRYVRYGWGDYAPGNLHGGNGLPARPFNITIE